MMQKHLDISPNTVHLMKHVVLRIVSGMIYM